MNIDQVKYILMCQSKFARRYGFQLSSDHLQTNVFLLLGINFELAMSTVPVPEMKYIWQILKFTQLSLAPRNL